MTELPDEEDPAPSGGDGEGWLSTVSLMIAKMSGELRYKSQEMLYKSRPISGDLTAIQELIARLMAYIEDEVLSPRTESPEGNSSPLLINLSRGFPELFTRSQTALNALQAFDEAMQYYGPPERQAERSVEEHEHTQDLVKARRRDCVEALKSFRDLMVGLTTDIST